jgi:hypothetical protein
MGNLIVELEVFKVHNEKLKKAQEDQQEINEMLLRIITTKKSPRIMRSIKSPPRILVMKQKEKITLLRKHA